ncbi:DUF397 domain-containing protein [Nonomuraea sp. CA-143628]|uniref:DUF397 domain-containing protein n=1 Tax=Nonomuraea sp. CA-143628 TaxID=3239997 RepID=UPI003D8AA983
MITNQDGAEMGMKAELSRASWRKSSHSNNGGNCVEIAIVSSDKGPKTGSRLFAVRDSKDPNGPALIFTPSEWDAFVSGVKDGEFDETV